MAIMVQRTIGNQGCSLFHHGLIKMLVQYQLVTVGKTWDEFLKENDFGFMLVFLWEDPGLLYYTNKTPSSLALSATDRRAA